MFTEASEVAPLLCFVTFTNTTFTNTISRTDQSRIWRIRLDTNGGVVVTSAVVASPTSFTFTNSTFTGAVVGTAAYPSIVTLTGEVVTLTLISAYDLQPSTIPLKPLALIQFHYLFRIVSLFAFALAADAVSSAAALETVLRVDAVNS
jgi:hypothetical protein